MGSVVGLGTTLERDFKEELIDEDPTLASTNLHESSRVQAVIDQWGAGYALEAIEWKSRGSRVGPQSAPATVYHGSADQVIVPSNSEWLCQRYAAVGVPCSMHLLPGYGHGAWNATLPGNV